MEEGFVAVAQVADLAPGTMKFVAVERERIVLANVDGSFYALRDVCGHRNAPLSRGRLEGHGSQADRLQGPRDVATDLARRIGDMIFGTQSAGITPEFAQVLRSEILYKDHRWFLLNAPAGERPVKVDGELTIEAEYGGR